jgi:hypothetical protein
MNSINFEYISTTPDWMKEMLCTRYILNEEGEVCMSNQHPSLLREHTVGKSKANYEEGHQIKGELVRCFKDDVVHTLPTKEVAKLLSPEF